ncbi:MAG TPA: hypothetical protein VN616_04925 [Puia sp.]|nr:hypothetical protein [Puia sp.]
MFLKKKKKKKPNPFREFGTAVGVGLLAGLAGTVAITVSQTIEMKLSKRGPSTVPADAAGKALDIRPTSQEAKSRLSHQVHWAYGTGAGVTRGLMSLAGLKGWPATLAHFSAIWTGSMLILPALDLAPPVQERKPGPLLIDGLHHAVYAAAAGIVFDAIAGWRK